jgi:hypothetical protein
MAVVLVSCDFLIAISLRVRSKARSFITRMTFDCFDRIGQDVSKVELEC